MILRCATLYCDRSITPPRHESRIHFPFASESRQEMRSTFSFSTYQSIRRCECTVFLRNGHYTPIVYHFNGVPFVNNGLMILHIIISQDSPDVNRFSGNQVSYFHRSFLAFMQASLYLQQHWWKRRMAMVQATTYARWIPGLSEKKSADPQIPQFLLVYLTNCFILTNFV